MCIGISIDRVSLSFYDFQLLFWANLNNLHIFICLDILTLLICNNNGGYLEHLTLTGPKRLAIL